MPSLRALAWLLVGGLLACEKGAPFLQSDMNASSAERGSEATPCPASPSWAGELPSKVFVELLHLPAQEGRAVGFRVHEDGKLESYAEVELVLGADGALVSRSIEGAWKEVGRVQPKKLEFLRRLVNDPPPAELEAWSRHRGGGRETTLFRLRRDGQIIRTCYFGDRAPPPLGAIERQVLDLRLGVLPPPPPP